MKKPHVPKPKAASDPKAVEAIAHGVVRRVNRLFASDLPAEAQRSGAYDVPQDELAAQAKEAVPNGLYCVLGHDWVHRFSGGKWIGSVKRRSDTDPSGIVVVA